MGTRKADADKACRKMAFEQDGLFTTKQGLAAGHTEQSLRYRVRSGVYVDELPGVLAIAGAPRSRRRAIRAAAMWGGEGAATSHGSAARLHGLDIAAAGPVDIAITRWKKCYGVELPDGTRVRVHRVDEHLLTEIVDIEGIPVTSVRRTILDLAAVKHPRAERMLDFCLTKELSQLGDIWLYLEREWMRGRRGVKRLRDLLLPRTTGYGPSDSDLEILLRRVVARYDLPMPVPQYPIDLPFDTVHADFAYPEGGVVIELDSYAHHLDKKAFERDRERDNELRALGWTVLRFTWAMLRFEPERVAELIRRALALSAPKPTKYER